MAEVWRFSNEPDDKKDYGIRQGGDETKKWRRGIDCSERTKETIREKRITSGRRNETMGLH